MTPTLLFAASSTRVLIGSPLGFLIGLSLGALGGGGSILAVPVLVYVVGQSAHAATTSSLVVVGSAAVIGMIGHFRAGRVRLRAGIALGLAGLGGSFAGSELNKLVPSNVLLLAFACLMLLVAWRMWSKARGGYSRPAGEEAGERMPVAGSANGAAAGRVAPMQVQGGIAVTVPARGAVAVGSSAMAPAAAPVDVPVRAAAPVGTRAAAKAPSAQGELGAIVRVLIVGTCVGFLTGFFGVGGGFVIVPGLVLALGYEMPVAVGTSLLVIVISSVEALSFRLTNSTIDWSVAAPFAVASIVGVAFGNAVAGRVPAAQLNRWFVWLLLALAIYTATESLIKLT